METISVNGQSAEEKQQEAIGRRHRPPMWVLLIIGIALIWIYGYRISENPLLWEEPRRCLVASEMIHRGDYIVPRVFGELYRNKPPLQNWFIILLSGNKAERVGPLAIRSISIFSVLGISWMLFMLWRVCLKNQTFASAWFPVMIFITMGITIQYGRFGELDLPFTFWVVAAFTCFEIGRHKGRAWVQWFLSQALLAGGILTKGLAPFFFYPPVLFCLIRERKKTPFSLWAFIAGLGAEILLVSAWIVPYASQTSVSSLGNKFSQEILKRTPLQKGLDDFFVHLFSFPLEILGNALPWSLLFLLWLSPSVRKALLALGRDVPLLKLSIYISLWAFVVMWLMPGAKGRYMIPVYPFLAIILAWTLTAGLAVYFKNRDSMIRKKILIRLNKAFIEGPAGWIIIICLFSISIFLISVVEKKPPVWDLLSMGVIVIMAIGYYLQRLKGNNRTFWGLALAALLYAMIFAGVSAVHKADKAKPMISEVEKIASSITKPWPVMCERNMPFGGGFYMIKQLGRLIQISPIPEGPYYLVTYKGIKSTRQGRLLTGAGPFELWEIPPE